MIDNPGLAQIRLVHEIESRAPVFTGRFAEVGPKIGILFRLRGQNHHHRLHLRPAYAERRTGEGDGTTWFAMARYYFAGTDAVGRAFTLEHGSFPEPLTVIGVVKDAKYRNLRQPSPRLVYVPMRQVTGPLGMATIEVRTAADPRQMTDLLWREAQSVSKAVRIGGATTEKFLWQQSDNVTFGKVEMSP
jgi:hypothetical protein